MVQLSHLHKSTGKTIAFTTWDLVGKVMSLLFNMLSRFVIVFSSKEQVSFTIMTVVTVSSDFGIQENKICHCFYFSPNYLSKQHKFVSYNSGGWKLKIRVPA